MARNTPQTPWYANPVGQVSPAVPASTVAVTNTYGADAVVYIIGGTITAIKVNGVSTGLTSSAAGVTVIVPQNQTVSITYSVAPTWTWLVL